MVLLQQTCFDLIFLLCFFLTTGDNVFMLIRSIVAGESRLSVHVRVLYSVQKYIHLHRIRPHRIGGNLKLLRQSTNADRKRLKIAFSIANCRFRLPICDLKRCFNAYRSALLDSRDSSRLPPMRCEDRRQLWMKFD